MGYGASTAGTLDVAHSGHWEPTKGPALLRERSAQRIASHRISGYGAWRWWNQRRPGTWYEHKTDVRQVPDSRKLESVAESAGQV